MTADVPGLHVVFDCADPDRMAKFWMLALPGYDFPAPPPDGFDTWESWADANKVPEDQRNLARTLVDKAGSRPTIFFNQVPEPHPPTKNRLHLDVKAAEGLAGDERRSRLESTTARLVDAGATVARMVDGPEGFWLVLQDPEGNEFCVI
ncbi:VOC family protein [Paractinoplanes rishiriensis]|uniref:Glyoxalase-like domain-containing protein n=1 Tax=Paractinoplanes rishiriensis TaxID=1050105 RepID=A0A919K317_9ACTN|nr:VOC family protein [Actinoplanes rishiriensis]GIE99298.1 hypothetical protein Ari01nite_67630 [Actinoplanes rishiriensis]